MGVRRGYREDLEGGLGGLGQEPGQVLQRQARRDFAIVGHDPRRPRDRLNPRVHNLRHGRVWLRIRRGPRGLPSCRYFLVPRVSPASRKNPKD